MELQQQRDAVRIKEKQLEDHAHSLQQLRREAVEGEREREAARREVEEMRRRAELEQENTEQMQVCASVRVCVHVCVHVC